MFAYNTTSNPDLTEIGIVEEEIITHDKFLSSGSIEKRHDLCDELVNILNNEVALEVRGSDSEGMSCNSSVFSYDHDRGHTSTRDTDSPNYGEAFTPPTPGKPKRKRRRKGSPSPEPRVASLKYKCLKCNKRYKTFYAINNHVKSKCCVTLKRYSGNNKIQVLVSEGDKYDIKESEIAAQIDDRSITKLTLCPKCGEVCADINEIDQCNPRKVFQCYCRTFKSHHRNNLKFHIQTEHPMSDLTEQELDDTLMSYCSIEDSHDIYEHKIDVQPKEIINDKIQIYCRGCDSVLDAARVHSKRNNCYYCVKPLSYRCANCKRQYSNSSAVHNHLRYECNNQPQFGCPHCEYRAKQKGNLLAHIQRKHTAKECAGCGLKFNDNVSLRMHMSTQCRTETMLRCQLCTFTCNFITKMKEHVRIEHKSRYQCRQCGKKYKNYKSLKSHENACGSKADFQCEYCDYKTTYKVRIQAHLQTRHPELAYA
ncbi:zinc finger protein ZFMSA12A-like isoform X2 [Phymastichus coffea]|uniref:zinc finger protein ZFMSA12A-like isoform X2 n=1 Tax=Phymastichus coffea TaxID=108790 RepID=UPI00273C3F2C|nr:zinc finger protein ZFMSA12A-like isoform X2 [Phymastichus coffea]